MSRILNILNRCCTGFCYFMYPLLLVMLILSHNQNLVKAICVPGISFVVVSLLRHFFNFKRPYELLDIEPIIKKNTSGKSMPSRHVFSVFIISVSWYCFYPFWGIILFIVGIILSFIRVIGGVHFPRDVIVGALLGIICGVVGFFVI